MWWALFACMDYTIEEQKDFNNEVDTASIDSELDDSTGTTEDTASTEDTEDSIIEDPEIADAKMYANSSGELYEIDPDTGYFTFIGEFRYNGEPVDHFEDIAIDLTGHMYGGTGEWLYLINPSTAEVRPICPLEIDTTALTFTSEGELIIGVDSSLYKMDIENCSLETLVAYSFYETSGDIVGLPDGYLYWSVRGGDEDRLVRVNPRTGHETLVGYIGENRLYGMGYSNNELFGFSGSGNIVAINPETGNSSFLKEYSSISWWGATTNPVVWEE